MANMLLGTALTGIVFKKTDESVVGNEICLQNAGFLLQ